MNKPTLEHYDPHSFAYISAMKRGEFEPAEDCKEESQARLFPDTNIEKLDINALKLMRKKRLCENYDKAMEYQKVLGADNLIIKTKEDLDKKYKEELVTTLNLSLGSALLIAFIAHRWFYSK